jgi:outer membrane protein assembly factor BamB
MYTDKVRFDPIWRWLYNLTCITVGIVLTACATRSQPVVVPVDPPAGGQATVGAPPPGVHAEVWRSLVTELDRVVAQSGTARRTSGAPVGAGSCVPDLHSYTDASNSVYIWSYRQHGDYDLNGRVDATDLVPVGINFGKTMLSPDWQRAQLADGDGNGAITVGDVAPIGLNFHGRVDGYELQWRQSSTEPWAKLASAQFVAGTPASGLYPQYQKFTVVNPTGPEYRVLPFYNDGTQYIYGPQSNIIGPQTEFYGFWTTARGDTARDGTVLAYGPDNANSVWTYDLGATGLISLFYNEPVADFTGAVYIGSGDGDSLTSTSPSMFYAINMNGKLRWKRQMLRSICGSASCSRTARIVVGDIGGTVYCFAPDGKQLWRRQISGVSAITSPLIDSADNVYILGHNILINTISNSTLYKLDSNGAVVWSRDLACTCIRSPFFDADGNPSVVCDTGFLIAYKPDGSLWNKFDMDFVPSGYLFATGGMERGGMIYYATDNNFIRLIKFDGTAPNTYNLNDEYPLTMPSMDILGNIAIGTRATSSQTPKLKYINNGALLWEIGLPGTNISNIAMDLSCRMYFATCWLETGSYPDSNTIQCVLQDQTKSWSYITGDYLPFKLALVKNKLLVCTTNGPGGMRLYGISEN